MRRLALVVLAVLAAGCGSSDGTRPALTLALDFTPNAVHAPLYAAAKHGAFTIRQPGSGPDGLKLVVSGKADLGVLDIHDLAIARERGTKVVAIGALVERPLAALVARGGRGIARPRDLEGRTVGVSGLPSDPAFVDAIVRHDGGDPHRLKQVTIGFSAVTRILSGRVDAAPVFWNAEGVVLKQRGLDTREFRVDDYGAPPYPEVVLVTSEQTLRTKRAALHDALLAIANGIQTVRADPQGAARQVAEAAGTKDVALVRAQLDAVLPLYGTTLDRHVLARWADFDARIGIVKRTPDVDSAFAVDFGKDLGSTAS
jgi:NitT/TauT family transport system substrate-binding protein/putative hydroxymethylpyrimidine transport system substrate-binding protein